MLLSCGKAGNTLDAQMVSATFMHLISYIGSEKEIFLTPLLKCFAECLKVIGSPAALSQDVHNGIAEAINSQLQAITDKRKNRSQQPKSEVSRFGIMEIDLGPINEDMETFALDDMAKIMRHMNPQHPLLEAISNVKRQSNSVFARSFLSSDAFSNLSNIFRNSVDSCLY